MSNDLIKSDSTSISLVSEEYGHYVKRSTLCPICRRSDHNQINLARARDHVKIYDMCKTFSVQPEALKAHFTNHFIVSPRNQKVLDLLEDDSSEAKELVTKILEGNIDLMEGAEGVLKSKGQRLHIMTQRIKELSDKQEIGSLEDIEVQELVQLHKITNDLEDSIMKVYAIVDKKLFPFKKEELGNAVAQYKLSVLSKLLDKIQIVFLEFEGKSDTYSQMISEMRVVLARHFNDIEDTIVKAGGIIQPLDKEESTVV